eukprot:442445-Prorocentrum_lima.AAC.1
MTSSLVGSEMCIRDRMNGLLGQVDMHVTIMGSHFQEEKAVLRSCESESAEPVSYTHLTLPTICSV